MRAGRVMTLAALMVPALICNVARATEHPKKTEHPTQVEHPAAVGDIVAVASSATDFTTLVSGIQAADLVEHLRGEGPFTVFAPTDSAFAKLPPGTLEDLLKPENKAQLSALLSNHVVPGKIMAADIKTMKAVNAAGNDLDIVVKDGRVTVNGATVVEADISASNGVIHAIDQVLLPAQTVEHPSAEKHHEHPSEHPKK